MIEIFKFIFSSFWVWVGTLILLVALTTTFCSFITFMAEAFRSSRQGQTWQPKGGSGLPHQGN